MKNLKLMIAFMFLCGAMHLSAQKKIDVKEVNTTMSLGARNGYAIVFEEMTKKELKGKMDDFMKQYGKKIDLEEITKTEYLINDVIITQISDQPIDVYLLFEEGKKGTMITGFFDTGDQFISSANAASNYQQAENFMRRFALRVEKIKVEEKVSAAEKVLSKKQDEQKDLEKKNTALNNDIKDHNAAIEKAKQDLDQNAKDQEVKKKEIDEQTKTLNGVKAELDGYKEY